MRNANNILVGKPEGKRPLERPVCRWEDNIRIAVWEIGWQDLDWFIWIGIGSSGGLL
jgi:hypothetical protein